jgi:hypothetical protein
METSVPAVLQGAFHLLTYLRSVSFECLPPLGVHDG